MKKSGFMTALTLGAMPLLHSIANAAPQPAAPPLAERAQVSFSIAGEVARPGKYELNLDKPTLLDLIAASGGLTRNPARVHVKVRRGARIFDINIENLLKSKVNFALQDGDVVTVTSPRVFITGAVKKPGFYPLPESGTLSIAEALALAGGPIEAQGNDVMRLPAATPGKSGRSFLPIPPSQFNQLLQEDDCLLVSHPKVQLPFPRSLFRTNPVPKPDGIPTPPSKGKFYLLESSAS